MKESVGESSMTIVTIILVTLAIGGLYAIITTLVSNQGKRASCENEGGSYSNQECTYNGSVCTYNEEEKTYICG